MIFRSLNPMIPTEYSDAIQQIVLVTCQNVENFFENILDPPSENAEMSKSAHR